jgi:hypothetical protein
VLTVGRAFSFPCGLCRRRLQFMGFGMEYAPFIILYGIALEWCFRTAGEPYAAAK